MATSYLRAATRTVRRAHRTCAPRLEPTTAPLAHSDAERASRAFAAGRCAPTATRSSSTAARAASTRGCRCAECPVAWLLDCLIA
eukprot:4464258-Prymnesium_polylepis.1